MSRVSAALRTLASTGFGTSRRTVAGVALLGVALAPLSGCTSAQLDGQASSYVIIDNIQCANGADPTEMAGTCDSDVQTLVDQKVGDETVKVITYFEDPGSVAFRLGMKNPSLEPSPTNFITITRYRVEYVRADGRRTPGVDVPYPFDGAITVTVRDTPVAHGFSLVRMQSKLENPLRPLAGFGGSIAIATLAEVTFFGTDQAGREVSVMGRVGVTFADWGDPE